MVKIMKKQDKKAFLSDLKEKTNDCIESRKNANKLIEIIALLRDEDESKVLAGLRSINRVFCHYLDVGELTLERSITSDDPGITSEEKYKLWLRERYSDVVGELLSLVQRGGATVKELTLATLMKFLVKDGKTRTGKDKKEDELFPLKIYALLLNNLLSRTVNNQGLLSRLQEYLEYDDVRFKTLKVILSVCQTASKEDQSEVLLSNLFSLLEKVTVPGKTEEDQELTNFLSPPRAEGGRVSSVTEHRKLFTSTWVEFLRLKLSAGLYRRTLVILHERVMPGMSNPLLLSDFLTDSYNIGGALSLLALNGLFILIQKYNLNYPDFYTKLYALFDPTIFHVKYRARFFHLCDLFLSSTHLPAYLVAAFAKKLAQVSLTAPPSGLLIAIPFIYNLIIRHPVCKQLIDRHDNMDYTTDPYKPDEPDPAKCDALRSSLWEIKTMQQHYHPDVAKAANKIDVALPDLEKDLSEIVDLNADELFEKNCSKTMKTVAVTFERPVGLIAGKDSKLNLCWKL